MFSKADYELLIQRLFQNCQLDGRTWLTLDDLKKKKAANQVKPDEHIGDCQKTAKL